MINFENARDSNFPSTTASQINRVDLPPRSDDNNDNNIMAALLDVDVVAQVAEKSSKVILSQMKVSYLKHILESNFTHILFSRQQHRGRWTSHQSHLFPLPMIRATYFASQFNRFPFRLGTHYLFTIDALIHCL